jgi:[ribosomal protein S5]-alanine N-acetyltransferase
MVTTRLIMLDDAAPLAELIRRNREFLAPWEPVRAEGYFTEDGQRRIIEDALRRCGEQSMVPHVILAHGDIVGRVNLNNIVRGPFQSASLGYWVSARHNGRGIATEAVSQIKHLAFGELGLHRIEAGTLLHNAGSQRVLERNGFERFGLARAYLQIAGRWQDHVMFQAVNRGA